MPDALQRFKADFFKALAHPVRIKILETLRDGGKSVMEMQSILGIDQSSVSQQLSVLRVKGLITADKAGTSVYYRVCDPLLFDLLDVARRMFNNQLTGQQSLLSQLEREEDLVVADRMGTSP
ncbi:MAG: ArsR/SmtB family transcription factor [Thermomicrobiales bacterium]